MDLALVVKEYISPDKLVLWSNLFSTNHLIFRQPLKL